MNVQGNSKPASSRQIGYIRKLQTEAGVPDWNPQPNMTSWQASRMIAELLSKQQAEDFVPAGSVRKNRINHVRLGLAMKMCFRMYTYQGHDVWNEHRTAFKKRVIATYNLFTEISETMDRSTQEPQQAAESGFAGPGKPAGLPV